MWSTVFQQVFEFSHATASFGVNLLAQSAILTILGLIAARCFRRRGSPVQSAILRVTLAAIILCPFVSVWLDMAGINGLAISLPRGNVSPQITDRVAQELEPLATQTTEFSPATGPRIPEPPPPFPAFSSDTSIEQDEATAAALPEVRPRRPTVSLSPDHAYAAVTAFWIVISSALLIRLCVAHLRVARAKRLASEAPSAVREACRLMAQEMGTRFPDLLISRRVRSPCLIGFRRPTILLPPADAVVSREVVLHELTHLARHDCLWNLVGSITRAVIFFQPLVWILTRRIEDTSDEVADDCVVRQGSDRRTYARQLVHIAESFRPAPSEALAGMGVVSLQSSLGRRVQRILDTGRTLSLRTGTRVATTVAVFGLLASLACGLIGAGRRSVAPKVDEVAGKTKETEPVDEDYPYSLKGRVVDSSGKPIQGARVVLMNQARIQKGKKSGLVQPLYTDAHGEFTIPDLGEGQALLAVSAEGHKASELWSRTDTEDLEIRLKSPSENSVITVRLRDDEEKPVKNAPVELYLARTRPGIETIGIYSARTDAQGKVEFSVPPGGDSGETHALIRCDMEGYDLTYNALFADRDLQVRLILHQPDQHWAGKIVDTNGQPIAGARLHLNSMAQPWSSSYLVSDGSPWSGSELTFLGTTNEDGDFRLDRFSKKDLVTVIVSAPGYARKNIGFIPQETTETLFELQPGARVRGRVVLKPSGEPVPGARIRFHGLEADVKGRAVQAGADGSFVLNDVRPDHYFPVYVPEPGTGGEKLASAVPGLARDSVEVGPDEVVDVTVEVKEGVRIGGRLLHTLTWEPVLVGDTVVVAYHYVYDFLVRETRVKDDGTWEMYLADGVYDLRPRGFDEEKNETVEGPVIHKIIVREGEPHHDVQIEWYPEWREDFDEVYYLEEGEVLKRIPPPFIPARRMFYFTESHEQAQAIRYPPSYFRLVWDESLSWRGCGFIGEHTRLPDALSIIGLKRNNYECSAELLELEVPGDWIYRGGTEVPTLVRALENILREEMGYPVRFTRREVERDVIVARGVYQFQPLPEFPDQNSVIICTDPNREELGGGGGGATVNRFLKHLGDRINLTFIDETESSDAEMGWLNHRSTDRGKIEGEVGKTKRLLDNLSKQTSLQFTWERRKVPVWFVTEQGEAHPGDDPNVSMPVSGKAPEGEDGTDRTFLEHFRERCQFNADSISVRNIGTPDMVWIYDGDVKITIPCGENSITTRADRVVCDLATQTLTATGNVAIGDGGHSLRSASMVYQAEEGRAHLSGKPGESLGVNVTRRLDAEHTITYQTDWLSATFGEGGIQGIDSGRGEAKLLRAEEESVAVIPSEEEAAGTGREPRFGSSPPARTIHFPKDRCMGKLRMTDHGTDKNPEDLGEARGTVIVPEGKDIILFIGGRLDVRGKKIDPQEAFQDLSPLAKLGPDDLQTLSIRGPELTDDDLVHLRGLTDLRDLIFSRSSITDQGLLQLQPLAGLRGLTLLLCERITDQGLDNLKHLDSLRSLTLSDMKGVTGEGLEGLRSLEQLGLIDCPNLTAEGLASLEKSESLQELDLGHNDLWNEKIAHIRLPKSLKRLDFREAEVLDETLACMENLKSLEELDLGRSGISGAALVHLKDLKSLKRLRLEYTDIDDSSLAHLSELTSLEFLGLESTPTGDEGLSHLGKLTSLKEITLGYEVTDAGMQYLGNLTALKELRLVRRITDAGLAQLTGLKTLERLTLHDSQVTDAGLAYLKEMASLEDVRLWRRPITDTGLAHLSHVGSLKALHLSDTKITNAGLVHLKKLPSLETLGLENTQVSDEGLVHVGGLPSLTRLYLCGTQITDAGLAHLGKLSSLEFLDLQVTNITGEGLRHLDRLKSLKTLFLFNTQLTDDNLKHLRNFTSLEDLALGKTAITDAGLDDLKALTSLKTLRVYETKLSKEGIRELREALPDCMVYTGAYTLVAPPKPKEKEPGNQEKPSEPKAGAETKPQE